MTESLDRTAIKADAKTWADLHRPNFYQREGVKRVDALLAALEEAERDLAGYGTRGALAYEREERMGNLRLKIEALKERNAWRARAEEAERRIAAVEKVLAESDVPQGVMFDGTPFPRVAILEDLRAALHPVAEVPS